MGRDEKVHGVGRSETDKYSAADPFRGGRSATTFKGRECDRSDVFGLPPRRLVREGVPIAAILLFWYLLGAVAAEQGVGGPVRSAGLVMATLYVVVRGVGLSSKVIAPATDDLERVLAENVRIALPAGFWFLGGVVDAVDGHVHEFSGVTMAVASALAGAGLGVVGLYAVAAGTATFDNRGESDASASASGGD